MSNLRLSITLRDELGVDATVATYAVADPGMTLTQLDALLQAIAAAIRACTSATIVSIRAALLDTFSGTNDPAAAGSRIEQTGVLDFSNTTNTRLYGLAIPALLDSAISGGHLVTGSSPLSDLITDIVTSGANYNFATEQFIPLNGGALADSFLSFRKRRKFLRQRTVTP